KISSTMVYPWRKSKIDTLGNCATKSRCKSAELASSFTVVEITLNCGACSSTPAGKTMVKLDCNCPQSTLRMLATVVSIRTPCTLKPTASPSPILASLAKLSEIELTTGSLGCDWGVQVRSCTSSEFIGESR